MAQEQRTDIQFKIDDWIKTNGNKEITGVQMNEVLSLLSDSMFNKIDEPRPTIEPAAKTSASFYVNSDDPVSGLEGFLGPISIDLTSETLTSNLSSVRYLVSQDGTNFTSTLSNSGGLTVVDTLAHLSSWVTTNITSDTQKWYVIVIAEYFASDLGLGLVRFQY